MGKNIDQVFVANPAASMQSTDLCYLGRSPYGVTNDMAITFNNFQLSITSVGTIGTGVWQGTPVALAYGGTNNNITADNGAIVYSDGTKLTLLAHTTTANQVLLSGNNAAPTWSTPTYPSASGAAGKVLISDGTNNVYSTPTYPNTSGTAGKVLISDGTNNIYSTPTFPNASASSGKFIRSDGTNWIASTPTLPTTAGTSGKVLQSDGTNYVESTPTYPSASGSAGKVLRADGTNNVYSTATFADTYAINTILYAASANAVSGLATVNNATLTTNSSGVPTWSTTAGVQAWTDVTGTSATMAPNNGYIADNVGLVTLTLPTTAAVGTMLLVQGAGAGGWKIAQNANQIIHIGSSPSTTGATGSVASVNRYDSVQLVCIVANLEWACLGGPQSAGLSIA